MYTLVLLRHGESVWNKANLFTGWTDVPLSDKGVEEAKAAGHLLQEEGYAFDAVHTYTVVRQVLTMYQRALNEKMKWQWNSGSTTDRAAQTGWSGHGSGVLQVLLVFHGDMFRLL